MTKKEFKKYMLHGLGRCVIELEESENIEKFRDIVLYGCLHNISYDTQCEGTRSDYMYVLQSKFEDDYFEPKIIEKFLRFTNDVWLFDTLCELLLYFALDGRKTARTALYKKLELLYEKAEKRKGKSCFRVCCEQLEWLCIDLVTLDGWKQFQQTVRKIGDSFDFSYFYDTMVEKYGEKKILKFLEKDALYCENTDAFLKFVIDRKKEQEFYKNKPRVSCYEYDLKGFLQVCREEKFIRIISRKFSRHASQEEIMAVAHAVIEEKELLIKAALLSLFQYVPFPLDSSILLSYAHSEQPELYSAAAEALALIKNPAVHDCAIDLLQRDRIYEGILCLQNNYKESAQKLLLEKIKVVSVTYREESGWHSIFQAALILCEKNKKAPNELLFYLYENTLCSFCRFYILKEMNKRKIISDSLLWECFYDSYQDIRKYAKSQLKRRGLLELG